MNTIHIAWTGSGFNVHVWFHLTNKQNIKKIVKTTSILTKTDVV